MSPAAPRAIPRLAQPWPVHSWESQFCRPRSHQRPPWVGSPSLPPAANPRVTCLPGSAVGCQAPAVPSPHPPWALLTLQEQLEARGGGGGAGCWAQQLDWQGQFLS